MKNHKKLFNAFLLLIVAAACGAAFFLDGGGDQPAALPVAAAQTQTPLETYRARRDADRALLISGLKAILTSELTDESARAAAQAQLLSLVERAEKETALEAAAAGMNLSAACAVRERAVIISVAAPLDSAAANGLIALARDIAGAPPNDVRILVAE